MSEHGDEDLNYTQRLSRKIDAAYQAYDSRDPDSLHPLHQALLEQACNIVYYRLRRPDEALTHDIVNRAYLNMDNFRGNCAFSTWFYGLAQNEVNRELERLIIEQDRLVFTDLEPDPDDETALRIPLEAKGTDLDLKLDVANATEHLNANQAETFRLAHEEGYTLNEVSETQQISLGTARSRYTRAIQKIRRFLGVSGESE